MRLRANVASTYRRIAAASNPREQAMVKKEKAERRRHLRAQQKEQQKVSTKGNKLFVVRPQVMV